MPLPDYALCVGINRYPGLTQLNGAEVDARAFYDWVTSAGNVAKQNARLIVSSQFAVPPDPTKAQPASQEIWNVFEEIRAAGNANNASGNGRTAGRRIYMFFSGHGFSPSLDTSGVLMANAERDTPHNLSAKAWADRFYENGLFDEVLLFQDACREQVNDVDLTLPYLKKSAMPGAVNRKRFYAFAAKSPLLSVEKPIGGVVRGVFSATLMDGLKGAAGTGGDITAAQLKSYLVSNMAARLEPADLANEDVSKRPEVFDLDPFVIVPAPAAGAAPTKFPVEVTLAAPGAGADVLDSARNVVDHIPAGLTLGKTVLPIGLYELVVPGKQSVVFKVSGAIGPSGQPEVVNVSA